MADKRWPICVDGVNQGILRLQKEIARRLSKKGPGAFIGPHETYGIIAEEVHELLHAIQENDSGESGLAAIEDELLDIAVAAILAVASMRS